MAAVYDEIADWYEQEFLARTAGTDALGITRALRGLLGPGGGVCRSGTAPSRPSSS
jgi:hypothetical protein